MKQFYQKVDRRSRTAMTAFLKTHFRYDTAHGWNCSRSYACNVKLHHLGLEKDIFDKLFDMIQLDDFWDYQSRIIQRFNSQHGYRWQACMNGRSSGYLVLYQGKLTPDPHKSYCTSCGQQNYQSVKSSGNTLCGVCGKPARVDYKQPLMSIVTYPGRGTDENEDFEDWTMEELRERVKLVQSFDRLADELVRNAVSLAQHYKIEKEEIYVPQERTILVPCG
ncbi:MAG: hypothetical protein MJ077_08035 [Oscillospiraceae bacterium]|nr:hypothetical protein [Oscillospiraceae bacterium]